MVTAFKGTDILKPGALPPLDYVFITHDHYDHLDYDTVRQLKSKTAQGVTSLGVGAHLRYWGVPADSITELDWWEESLLKNGCSITATPARHFQRPQPEAGTKPLELFRAAITALPLLPRRRLRLGYTLCSHWRALRPL